MKTMFDFLASEGLPPLAKSKFTKRIGDFDKLCEELLLFIPVVFFHFQWMNANSCEQRIVTLRQLGYMLFNLLTKIRELLEIRPKVLCDEHCGRFEQRVRQIDKHVRHIKNFITDADEMIDETVKTKPELITNGILRQFADFNSLTDWLMELIIDDDLLARTAKKCEEWNLHYDPHLSAEHNGDLRYWAKTTLYCVTMLAVNQHENDTDAELAELFTVNFNAFLEGQYWQKCEVEFSERLNERFANDLLTRNEKVKYVDRQRKAQRKQIVDFLSGLGISYSGIATDRKRGELCRQMYAHLNGVNMGGDETTACEKNMRNDDLCRYFTMEAHLRLLDMKKKELETVPPSTPRWKNNGAISADTNTDHLRQAIFKTVTWKDERGNQYFKNKSMWIAIYNVTQHYGLVTGEKGTMKLFATLMAEDWMTAVKPLCDYDSMKNTKEELRKTVFKDWNKTLYYGYWHVADIFVGNLKELHLIPQKD